MIEKREEGISQCWIFVMEIMELSARSLYTFRRIIAMSKANICARLPAAERLIPRLTAIKANLNMPQSENLPLPDGV